MRLFKNNHIKDKTFKWVKRNLDPTKSYIVFESKINTKNDSIFLEKAPVFEYFKDNKILWEHILDIDLLREYLVIQFKPGNEDKMLGKLIEYNFSKNIVYYLYKSQQ